jgi:HEPN domain-containing protein
MGVVVTSKTAAEAVRRLRARKAIITFTEMGELSKQLSNVVQYEVGDVEFYCMSQGASAFYSPPEPLFGDLVETRIPKASNDISEGGKCFATGRYTASVFHLMRAMEAAVQAISGRLGISNVEREWGKLLSDIATKIEPMPKGDERNDWSQVHANLYHVKQAWRNDTMHPKATYTEEEAREVFDAVKAFMRNLAELLGDDFDQLLTAS